MQTIKKEIFLIIIALISFACSITAQTWEEIGFNLPDGDTATHKTEITFANKDIGWMFTAYRNKSKLYKTTDGGKSWRTMKVMNGSLYSVAYSIEPGFFYMLNGNAGRARFTTDSGITWDSVKITIAEYRCLHFFNKEKGVALSTGYSWTTTDGGKNWNKKGAIVLPMGMHFNNENLGWAAGSGPTIMDGGYVAKTTNGGNSWEYINTNFPDLYGITFIDSLKGFTVGLYNALSFYKTTDSGINWQMDTTSIGGYNIDFLDKNNGWISAWGEILRTSDGGETWTNQLPPNVYASYRFMKLIILKKDKAAYVLGINNNNYTATLLKADLSNITDIEENKEAIPNKFYLYQNYPNPFNPSTVISYRLPVTGHVTLKIYDVLGREVATLVNEQKSAGKYSVQWNGSQLASGVYISRLTAGKFKAALKMILIK